MEPYHHCRDGVVATGQPVDGVIHPSRKQHAGSPINGMLVPPQPLQFGGVLLKDRIAQPMQRERSFGLEFVLAARLRYPAEQHARRPGVFAVVSNVYRRTGPEEKIEDSAERHGSVWKGG